MCSLKESLQTLVKDYKIKNGLLDELEEQAFNHFTKLCTYRATAGFESIKSVPLHFVGVHTGNLEHQTEISKRVEARLLKEGLRCKVSPHLISGSYLFDIFWS